MKKVLDVFKKPLWLLCLGLGIVLFASIFANMTNTSAYKVSVTEVKIDTEDYGTKGGELVGLLYRPKSCTKDNPCATIITTHGYLNTKEMQDAPAIELSKRGYVVLALDQYDHGDSTRDTGGFSFWITSQYHAAKYMYDQDYVLKASDGTGMIAVAGHSMGGFSSRMAAFQDSLDGGKQMISVVLAMGADFQWPNVFGISTNNIIAADVAAKRSVGTVAGRYDEFFFNKDCKYVEDEKTGDMKFTCVTPSETVTEKDWGKTIDGKAFYYGEELEVVYNNISSYDDVESGVWNETSYNGGGSVIYRPNEIHPWNHFSLETTGYQVDFYNKAFENQFALHEVTASDGVVEYKAGNGQTWWLKETFECIALVGMFIAIIASVGIFATLPFFNTVKTKEEDINVVSASKGARKWFMTGLLVASCFATAYVFPMIAIGNTTAYVEAVKGIMWASAIIALALLIAKVIVKAVKGEDEKAEKTLGFAIMGSVLTFVSAFFSHWTLTRTFFGDATYYNEPTTNVIAYWVLVSAGLTIIALVIGYFLSNKKDGYTCANYGLKANWKQVLMALLIAVIVVAGVYVLTFAIEALLRVDFRVWTYAIKPFAGRHFVAFLKYLPVFFLFFLVNAISTIANTGSDKSWKGTLKAVLISALPLVLLVGVHYGMLFATGTAKWPTQALNMILVWVLPITMGFAAWIARKSYQKTGNIWTGVFINAILFTLIQVANTALYLS